MNGNALLLLSFYQVFFCASAFFRSSNLRCADGMDWSSLTTRTCHPRQQGRVTLDDKDVSP